MQNYNFNFKKKRQNPRRYMKRLDPQIDKINKIFKSFKIRSLRKGLMFHRPPLF